MEGAITAGECSHQGRSSESRTIKLWKIMENYGVPGPMVGLMAQNWYNCDCPVSGSPLNLSPDIGAGRSPLA